MKKPALALAPSPSQEGCNGCAKIKEFYLFTMPFAPFIFWSGMALYISKWGVKYFNSSYSNIYNLNNFSFYKIS